MNLEEILEIANHIPGNFENKDVAHFFYRNNVGHWTSENGSITMNTPDGKSIIVEINGEKITTNYFIKPSGLIWLLGSFFQQFTPQVVDDISILNNDSDDSVDTSTFHQAIAKRLKNSSKIFKSNKHRYAFVERTRINSDNTILLTYDIKNLDSDNESWFAIVVPSSHPRAIVFAEYKNEIIKYSVDIDGRDFEDMKPWERADSIVCENIDKNDVDFVSRQSVLGGFLLTATKDNANSDKIVTI